MTTFSDEATAVALEHFLWAREQGIKNVEIMRSIGLPSTNATDRRTIDGLKRTWLALQIGWTELRHPHHRLKAAE
jgi:hypothetical protein